MGNLTLGKRKPGWSLMSAVPPWYGPFRHQPDFDAQLFSDAGHFWKVRCCVHDFQMVCVARGIISIRRIPAASYSLPVPRSHHGHIDAYQKRCCCSAITCALRRWVHPLRFMDTTCIKHDFLSLLQIWYLHVRMVHAKIGSFRPLYVSSVCYYQCTS